MRERVVGAMATPLGPYVPEGVLSLLHNSPRVGGNSLPNALNAQSASNGVVLNGDYTLDNRYVLGVALGPVFMLVCFAFWIVAVLLAGRCWRGKMGSRKTGGLVVIGLAVITMAGLILWVGASDPVNKMRQLAREVI